MTLALPRRRFLTGALSLLAAPAIVRASSLMKVRGVPLFSEPTLGQLRAVAHVYFRPMTLNEAPIPVWLVPELLPILRPDPAVGGEREADLDVEVLGEEAGERRRAAG